MFAKNGNGWRIGRTLRVAALAAAAFGLTLDAFAEAKPDGKYTETVDGIKWTYVVKGGKASVGGGSLFSEAISTYTKGAVTIPSTLGGCPVTSIGDYAFYDCSGLTSVTIPSSVTSIGGYAFYNCSGLTSVTIPSSVTSIGGSVFYGCRGLTEVTIPSSVTSIGDYAFYDCSGLTAVTISEGVTSIGKEAFFWCDGLKSVTIPSSVTSIGDYAFYDCDMLATVYVAKGDVDRVKGLYSWPSRVTFVEIERAVVPADVTGGKELVIEETWVTDELVARFGAGTAERFAEKFGDDLSAALLKPSGKTAADGSPMYVWQDYVAGTDPTDPNSKFTSKVEFEADGKPVVTWTPALNGERVRTGVRTYRVMGIVNLKDWTECAEGQEADFNFFKVLVEMP